MGRRDLVLLLWMVAAAAAAATDEDIAKAKQECAPQLAGLAPCLAYVGGTAKTPTMDCCSGMKQVLAASKKCVCLLVKYKDDPSLGVKFDINRALGVPAICHAPPALKECISLLHLSPTSPEAKMFLNYDKSASNATATIAPSSADTAKPASADTKPNGSHRSLGAAAALLYGLVLGFVHII